MEQNWSEIGADLEFLVGIQTRTKLTPKCLVNHMAFHRSHESRIENVCSRIGQNSHFDTFGTH